MIWTKTYTYEENSNRIVSGDYWTQTTTWDEAFNPKITAENRQNSATSK